MRAPMFAPPPPFDALEKVAHRLLDSSPLFVEYAEKIDDGWNDLVAAASRVDQERKRIHAVNRPRVAPISAAIFTDGFDVDDHVNEFRADRAAQALSEERGAILTMAATELLTAANNWVAAHSAQLLQMIQQRRLAIQTDLKHLLRGDLDGMRSARDLAHRPQHAEAYSRLQGLLAEWTRLRDVHAGIINLGQQDVRWFGASWVHNYAEAWQDLRRERNVQAPWQVTEEFELAPLIAHSIEVWTPTLAELDQHVANLDRAAEHRLQQRLEEANRLVSAPRR